MTQATSRAIAEESIAMRAICCLLSVVAITAGFIFGKSPVPAVDFTPMQAAVVLISVWLCIGGTMLSFHYRNKTPDAVKHFIRIGAVLILLNLARELIMENLHAQQFQFLYPMVDALIAASVLSSFELRTRSDIVSSAAFGLCLMSLAACSGRSILFGALVFLYMSLGCALLCLVARSQTAELPHAQSALVQAKTRGWAKPVIVASCALLPLATIAAFSFLPRLDSEADNVAASVRSQMTNLVYTARRNMRNELVRQSPNARAKPHNYIHKHYGDDVLVAAAKSAGGNAHAVKAGIPSASTQPDKKATPSAQIDRKAAQVKTAKVATNKAPQSGRTKTNKSDDEFAVAGTVVTAGSATPTNGGKDIVDAGRKAAATADKTASAAGMNAAVAAADAAKARTAGASGAKTANAGHLDRNGKPAVQKALPAMAAAAAPVKSDTIMDAGMVDLNVGLKPDNKPIFTLSCNRRVYVKLSSLDKFDGQNWRKSEVKDSYSVMPTVRGVDVSECPALWFSDAVPVMELTETFSLKKDLGYDVPVAGYPQQLSLLNEINVDNHGNLRSTDLLRAGTTYSAVCQWPVYSIEDMRKAPSYADVTATPDQLDAYLQLPDNQSAETAELAKKLTAAGSNRFVQAENIMAYLRLEHKYTMEPQTGSKTDNLVDTFLFDKKHSAGDCKAFASAFVVLCRTVGIPARLVVGFVPGDLDPVKGTSIVRDKHGHAWAEIYMEPYGWIAFDPTPGGLLPARPEEQHYSYADLKRQVTTNTQNAATTVMWWIESGLTYLGYLLAALGGGLSLYGLMMSLKVLRRIIKQTISSMQRRHPAQRYRDSVLRRLRRLGVMRLPSDTGADIVAKLEQALEGRPSKTVSDRFKLRNDVDEFFAAYNAVYFGKDPELARVKDLAATIAAQIK